MKGSLHCLSHFQRMSELRIPGGSLRPVTSILSNCESACLSGLHSIVAIKYSNQKQLRGEQGLCCLYFQAIVHH